MNRATMINNIIQSYIKSSKYPDLIHLPALSKKDISEWIKSNPEWKQIRKSYVGIGTVVQIERIKHNG